MKSARAGAVIARRPHRARAAAGMRWIDGFMARARKGSAVPIRGFAGNPPSGNAAQIQRGESRLIHPVPEVVPIAREQVALAIDPAVHQAAFPKGCRFVGTGDPRAVGARRRCAGLVTRTWARMRQECASVVDSIERSHRPRMQRRHHARDRKSCTLPQPSAQMRWNLRGVSTAEFTSAPVRLAPK